MGGLLNDDVEPARPHASGDPPGRGGCGGYWSEDASDSEGALPQARTRERARERDTDPLVRSLGSSEDEAAQLVRGTRRELGASGAVRPLLVCGSEPASLRATPSLDPTWLFIERRCSGESSPSSWRTPAHADRTRNCHYAITPAAQHDRAPPPTGDGRVVNTKSTRLAVRLVPREPVEVRRDCWFASG